MKRKLILFLLISNCALAQRTSVQQYISMYKDDAVKEMIKCKIPASITLAQALLESENGNSPLAINANNHFGIKCHKGWNGPTYNHDDDKKQECFRKYKDPLESFDDHSQFLMNRPHYASLFTLPTTDYKAWAKGLKKAGYATNPRYAEMLIKIIEDNKLYDLDRMKNMPEEETQIASNTTPVQKEESQKPVVIKVSNSPKRPVPNVKPSYVSPAIPEKRVQIENEVKYVIARPEDSYLRIAEEFKLGLWQILKYNEISLKTPITQGQRIYLEPKKKSTPEKEHIVQEGETLHDIAQMYALKLKYLKKINQETAESPLRAGQRILLQ